jgi:hypothetical protein
VPNEEITTMLVENTAGNYSFIRGIGPFSSGVVARPGFEIVHAAFKPFVPLQAGYDLVASHLRESSRPITAICGFHLRLPGVLSREAFDEFNRPYIERLRSWGLEIDGANPVARTNVALEVRPVTEPVIAGFYYTIASDGRVPTFVVSGVPEIASREVGVQIVARGDVSPEGMRKKAECVMGAIASRLAEMRVSWDDATAINLYTVQEPHSTMTQTILPAIGRGAQVGVTWHYSRPPVTGLELEIDVHAVRKELVLTRS